MGKFVLNGHEYGGVPTNASVLECTDKNGKPSTVQAELNDSLTGYTKPTVVALVSDSSAYKDESGNYILADSPTGESLLADAETYTTTTVEGNFYRMAGADSVNPFKSGGSYTNIVESLNGKGYDTHFTSNECIVFVGIRSSRVFSGGQYVYHEDTGDPRDTVSSALTVTGGQVEKIAYIEYALSGCMYDTNYVGLIGISILRCIPDKDCKMELSTSRWLDEVGFITFVEKVPE